MSEKEKQWNDLKNAMCENGLYDDDNLKVAKIAFNIGYITGEYDKQTEIIINEWKERGFIE